MCLAIIARRATVDPRRRRRRPSGQHGHRSSSVGRCTRRAITAAPRGGAHTWQPTSPKTGGAAPGAAEVRPFPDPRLTARQRKVLASSATGSTARLPAERPRDRRRGRACVHLSVPTSSARWSARATCAATPTAPARSTCGCPDEQPARADDSRRRRGARPRRGRLHPRPRSCRCSAASRPAGRSWPSRPSRTSSRCRASWSARARCSCSRSAATRWSTPRSPTATGWSCASSRSPRTARSSPP